MAATAAPKRAVRLAELRTHREQIHVIADRYGIHNVRVFGSVARDTATVDSDRVRLFHRYDIPVVW